ncbi:hypothetical protein COLO4_36629 [Corchorus olitorius]|uniref:Uncharacterized protein n=1 Tax=Corchorus olitorius TaxID=93759 RepID=A0A1R3G768_9ROSI|nr:hypothetical protein COLO4_36629 [Corchorus olitorius]
MSTYLWGSRSELHGGVSIVVIRFYLSTRTYPLNTMGAGKARCRAELGMLELHVVSEEKRFYYLEGACAYELVALLAGMCSIIVLQPLQGEKFLLPGGSMCLHAIIANHVLGDLGQRSYSQTLGD